MAAIPFCSTTKTGAQICVRLTPNAAQNRIDGIQTRDNNKQVLSARVTAVPDKGKANKALISLLAKTLKLPKSAFSISTGHTSRQKTLQIAGDPAVLGSLLNQLSHPTQP